MMKFDHPRLRVAFRTDASVQIGTGHVMRCLTLADALRENGAECLFICRPHDGHLLELIRQRGHSAVPLPKLDVPLDPLPMITAHSAWLGTDWANDADQTRSALGGDTVDWLVVDHYAIEQQWEEALRPCYQRLLVIDDLADRRHSCDLLVDQNLGRLVEDYCDLVPAEATLLIGPQYAMLRPEFAQLRCVSLARRNVVEMKHLLITMGGVDKDNATEHVLQALNLCDLPKDLRVSVVMGPYSPWLEKVREQAGRMHCSTQVLVGVSDMAQLMSESDLAIGAAGGTAWERCCLGVPSVVLVLAENQLEGAKAFKAQGAAVYVEDIAEVKDYLRRLFASEDLFKLLGELSRAAGAVTDGQGIPRIIMEVLSVYE
ncbi:hypothetical protein O987_16655 [Comamonas testosteroni TK102]|uniref:Glycosyl transferase family 28 C-terminal domain-containing protein n=1 Tax=Comamonas testosteroni TK102 TaxID=1392005 RepID=A0A076PUJ7_COMTE|nr:UDP-2,4-diacetamido-2,4,6-trideoxy-beta-L-altropyranose hydrolase [Comamonas testosteroni]AIJ47445.1 hypothetical protein O987_16655 [Comamonas testosteroni TK102]